MAFSVTQEDFANMMDFPLRWRWTDPKHTMLPEDIVSQIHPLLRRKAEELSKATGFLIVGGELNRKLHGAITCYSTEDDPEEVTVRLRELEPDSECCVLIIWDRNKAVVTRWGIFCDHWDSFCYPSSDDVLILPTSEKWTLSYWHEEQFEHALRIG